MLPSFLENLDPKIYFSENYVVLDFETDTSHGDYGSAVHADNGLLLACWKCGPGHEAGGKSKCAWGGEFDMAELVSDIEKADFLVAHQAKYELQWLKRCGLDLSKVCVFDTKIGEYVILGNLAAGDERMPPISTSLDQCCRRRGWPVKDPLVDDLITSGINPVRIPRPMLQARCRQDVASTERLYLSQLERMNRTGLLPVQYARCLLTPVLASIEFVGMCLDSARVDETYAQYEADFIRLEHDLGELTGGINWRSPKQVAHLLYDVLNFKELRKSDGTPRRNKANAHFPEGQPLTDKNTIEALEAKTEEQKKFKTLRGELGRIGAALSKNLEFFKGVCAEQGGVFKAVFNQTNTATHRLSSSGIPTLFALFDKPKTVQFQNLPRVFKRLFKARKPGWLMAEGDGSQLEFRAACDLGRCEASKKLIISGGDVHSLSTRVQFSLTEEEAAKIKDENPGKYGKMRTASKSWTFQPLYGGEGKTKLQRKYAKAFREAYPGIARAQEEWAKQVALKKYLRTPWGLIYYWPYAKLVRRGKQSVLNCKNAVYNYPVQGYATAEIIPIAVAFFWHRVIEAGLEDHIVLVNTIHDSIVCELDPDFVEEFKAIVKKAFTTDVYRFLELVYGIRFDFVPLGVGINVGEHWTEGEEESFNIYYDGTEERVK